MLFTSKRHCTFVGFENVQLVFVEATSVRELARARKVALFEKIFGKSASDAGKFALTLASI